MKLENEINGIIENKLNDGTIEKVVSKKFEECIEHTTDDLFRTYGDIGKLISNKLKEVLVPAIERSDFSENLIKLDTVLTEIVNSTLLQDNKKILENFKELMTEEEFKSIKVSELFKKYCEYAAKSVETTGLDVIQEDEVRYEDITVTLEIKECESYSTYFERADLIFRCEEDKDLNCQVGLSRLQRYDKTDFWDLRIYRDINIKSLRYMNEFDVLLNKLSRMGCQIETDERYMEESVTPSKEPELTYE